MWGAGCRGVWQLARQVIALGLDWFPELRVSLGCPLRFTLPLPAQVRAQRRLRYPMPVVAAKLAVLERGSGQSLRLAPFQVLLQSIIIFPFPLIQFLLSYNTS